MARRTHSTILWSLAILIALAGLAAAQDNVETRLEVEDPGDVDSWAGNPEQRSIDIQYCWETGGANPENETMTVEVQVSSPDWVAASAPDTITFEPPPEATEGDCSDPETVTVEFQPTNGDIEEDSFTIEVQFSARDTQAGTFLAPGDESAAFTVSATSDDGDSTPGGGDGEDEGQDWWPVIAIIVIVIAAIAVIAALVSRGRREY